MATVRVDNKGDYSKLNKYFRDLLNAARMNVLNKYGSEGVAALSAATPVDTGKTADSWYYEITNSGGVYSIVFHNSNISKDWFPVAIMLDVGHGTGTGGWVAGRNYIDPAIQPIFDEMADAVWEEVRNL
jgi:hypothetical protein